MLTPDNYDAYKGRQRRDDDARKQFLAVAKLEDDNSSTLSDAQLSNRVANLTGMPAAPEEMVKDNRELFREVDDRAWADRIRVNAPITLALASDSNSRPISRADADIFAAFEQAANKVGNAPSAMGDGASRRGAQLASALISASGPRGRGAFPPLPLPDPRKIAPIPPPDPRDSVPIPLSNPLRSAPVAAPSEGQVGAVVPASGTTTATPAEGAPGVSGNAAGAPSAASASSSAEAVGQRATSKAPSEQGNPSGNTARGPGTAPVQAGSTAGDVAGGVGQAAASEASAGLESSGLGAAGGATPAPDKATQAAPSATGGPAQAVGQPEAPTSAGQIDEGTGQADFFMVPASNDRLLLDIAFAKGKSPEEQKGILDRIYKSPPYLQFHLMDMYEAALNGEAPAELVGDLSPELRKMSAFFGGVGLQVPSEPRYVYYGNSIERGVRTFTLDNIYEYSEYYAKIGFDQRRSLGGIYKDQWSNSLNRIDERVLSMLNNSPSDAHNIYAGFAIYNGLVAVGRWAKARGNTLIWNDGVQLADVYFTNADKIQARIDGLPMSPEATRFETAMAKLGEEPSLSIQASKLGGLVADDMAGAAAYLTEKVTEGVPVLLLQAIATAVTKKPLIGVGLSTAFAAQQAHASEALKFIASKGFDLKEPGDIERLLDTPEVLREAEQRGNRRAFWAALAATASGSLGSKNPMFDLALKQLASPILAMGGETLGEIYSGQQLNAANIAMSGAVDFLNNTVSLGFDAGFGKVLARAQAGGHDYIALQKMIKDSETSTLRVNDPEAYESTVAALARGKPSEKIVLGIRELDFSLKNSKMDEAAFLAGLKGLTKADLETARKVGGVIQIPTEVFLTRIAHTPIGVAVTPFARFGVNGVSGAQAQVTANWLRQTLQNVGKSMNGARDGTPDPVTAPPAGAGDGAQGGEGGAGKASDTTPSDPSGATSDGSKAAGVPVEQTRAGEGKGADPSVPSSQPQTSSRELVPSPAPSKNSPSESEAIIAVEIARRRSQGRYGSPPKGSSPKWERTPGTPPD